MGKSATVLVTVSGQLPHCLLLAYHVLFVDDLRHRLVVWHVQQLRQLVLYDGNLSHSQRRGLLSYPVHPAPTTETRWQGTAAHRRDQPGIERVQALADISRSALCRHSNETRAPIANPPISAQLDGTPYIPSDIRVRAVWECGEGETDRHTDGRDQYTFHAKCSQQQQL